MAVLSALLCLQCRPHASTAPHSDTIVDRSSFSGRDPSPQVAVFPGWPRRCALLLESSPDVLRAYRNISSHYHYEFVRNAGAPPLERLFPSTCPMQLLGYNIRGGQWLCNAREHERPCFGVSGVTAVWIAFQAESWRFRMGAVDPSMPNMFSQHRLRASCEVGEYGCSAEEGAFITAQRVLHYSDLVARQLLRLAEILVVAESQGLTSCASDLRGTAESHAVILLDMLDYVIDRLMTLQRSGANSRAASNWLQHAFFRCGNFRDALSVPEEDGSEELRFLSEFFLTGRTSRVTTNPRFRAFAAYVTSGGAEVNFHDLIPNSAGFDVLAVCHRFAGRIDSPAH